MDFVHILQAGFLGIVEGLTEFIPVSSTGHLILVVDLLGLKTPAGGVFEIVIQLGAILAICWLYRQKLWDVAIGLPREKSAQKFTLNILLAFLPAVVIGLIFHDFIKNVLFSPWVVSCSLIVGGFAILLIERIAPPARVHNVDALSWRKALAIGFAQTIAMIPGVSRSGATIMGSLLLGVERKAAAEFSFFLAIPTMFGATAYDLYKNRGTLSLDNLEMIAIGFVTAFVSSLVVVRWLIRFISSHNFSAFAYYRIAVGLVMIALLVRLG